jgi:uncharacterized protein with HEPN domain
MTKTRKLLFDALESCRAIRRYTDGIDFTAYISDSEKQDAVERRLGIIGEALHRAERLEPTLADRLPEPREIVGMRNRIIHGYDVMDNDIVCDAMQNRLPALEIHLANLLGESEPQ